MSRRKRTPRPATQPPTPPDLILDPERAVLSILAYALDIATAALLAVHPSLVDDYPRPDGHGPIVALARTLCRRASELGDSLADYERAVRDAAASNVRRDAADLEIE
jgi:hypothetical protein